ncbi:APC family permease [Streptomyces sp. NPDC006925]|uniref:APC family permease n=1 Tax=Streptomyces sp. NPDC006925 TaxID=3364768 RepID=UPI0036C00BE6
MTSTERAPSGSEETGEPSLRRSIGLGQAIALYVGAVLGAGVLVLPGQAASTAGPASLLAWIFMGLLGLPLAMTFAALATKHPGAGGVATFATRAFGPTAGGLAGWFYFAAGSIGQTVVPLTGGYYVAAALQIDQDHSFVIAAGILAVATAANLMGLRISGRVQLLLAAGVALLLLTASVTALPRMTTDHLTPFAPHGLSGIAQAALTLFFAFAGWEAIAHLAGEFRDVRRDLRRATFITVVIVIVLYLGIAFGVVATGTYGDPELDRIAVGRVLGTSVGFSTAATTGVVATVISLGTTNAFIASVSRLGYALGKEGWLPAPLGKLTTRGIPTRGVWAVSAIGAAGLLLGYLNHWGTEDIVNIPAVLVLVTYLVGTAAGIRLLSGRGRALALTAFALTVLVTPFVASYALVPVVVAAVALTYRWTRTRTRPGAA